MALALLAIVMAAVIPALYRAGRNLVFAEETYAGHLQAQRIMLGVRGALADGTNPEASAARYAAGGLRFSVWIFGQHAQEFHSIAVPDADAAISGINMTMANYASTIIVVIWSSDGFVAGRAVGMLY